MCQEGRLAACMQASRTEMPVCCLRVTGQVLLPRRDPLPMDLRSYVWPDAITTGSAISSLVAPAQTGSSRGTSY